MVKFLPQGRLIAMLSEVVASQKPQIHFECKLQSSHWQHQDGIQLSYSEQFWLRNVTAPNLGHALLGSLLGNWKTEMETESGTKTKSVSINLSKQACNAIVGGKFSKSV